MSNGWIKIHRQILEWEWYDEPNTLRLFLHLLLKANHKPRNYRGVNIEAGQVMTGLDLLSKETGLTVQQIRTSIKRLKSTNEITSKTSSQGTIFQIVNYKKYQVVTSETTNEQQTNNKRTTTNKNVKKEKNVNTYREFAHLKLSQADYNKLILEYTPNQINDTLDSIENYKKNTNYTSLNLTLRKWLKKEYVAKQTEETISERIERLNREHKAMG